MSDAVTADDDADAVAEEEKSHQTSNRTPATQQRNSVFGFISVSRIFESLSL